MGIIIAVIISYILGYLTCKILSDRDTDGFCFLHKEGSKEQLIFNLQEVPESVMYHKVIKFRVVNFEEDVLNVSESQLQQRMGSVLSDPTNME